MGLKQGEKVMRNIDLRKKLIKAILGTSVLLFGAVFVSAQNVNDEYRDWQQAQAEAQREYRDYLRTRSQRDYRQWQAALRRAERQQTQYERAVSRTGNIYNSGYVVGNPGVMYRVNRGGRYYRVDSRSAELLRQAVNQGYAQGFRQGQIARQYGRAYNFRNESLYRSGTFGYQSYVDRNLYQYYFQQGFQRGFEDGYYSRYRYGTRAGNTANILGSVLNTILNLAQD
jgi:hypothetical protein